MLSGGADDERGYGQNFSKRGFHSGWNVCMFGNEGCRSWYVLYQEPQEPSPERAFTMWESPVNFFSSTSTALRECDLGKRACEPEVTLVIPVG